MKAHASSALESHSLPVIPRLGVMSVTSARSMEVTLAGGRRLKFNLPADLSEETLAERLEEILKLPALSIQADEKLFVIPTASIQTITVSPSPMVLPAAVIQGATLG